MNRFVGSLVSLASFLVVTVVWAGEPALTLGTAMGSVEKVEKDALVLQTRGAGGKFGKKLTLKLTGTSKLTSVAQEKRGGKLVPVQRDMDPKDLEPHQHISVIYLEGAEATLLSAVIQRVAK